jgi:predicted  nucleic acid-binding Zn-ribbon protein
MNYQISQLKEEIDTKENELNREHFEHKKKDKTIEEHDKVTKKYQKDIKEKEEKIKTYISEIAKLHFMIKESE